MKNFVLYNPMSNNNKGAEIFEKIKSIAGDRETVFEDITKIDDLHGYLENISKMDRVIVAGGDGTLNYFVNTFDDIAENVYFFPCGNGNDFARDVDSIGKLIPLSKYSKNLPYCSINGEKRKFMNGVGLGFDGYVCSKVNEARKETGKNVDYLSLALKGIFGEYKTTNATVYVDGVAHEFKDVWLCATMKGRYFGGGFMLAPKQNRLSKIEKVSLVVVHNAPVLKILFAFLLVFKGKHTILKKSVAVFKGKNIKVEFDVPAPLQIDGETYQDITSFETSVEKSREVSIYGI